MALALTLLDDVTRAYMMAEVLADIRAGTLHRPTRVTAAGWPVFRHLLLEAAAHHTSAWLALRLVKARCLRTREQWRRTAGAVALQRAVPKNASQVLADDVFNRYYIRAVCLRRLKEGAPQVQVYRARNARVPRLRSTRMEGTWVDAQALLEDLRRPLHEFRVTGLPEGPGSGLSVR